MSITNVDFVLLVDSSASMQPCFENLREHIKTLIYPLEQANFKVRFGLVAYAAGATRRGPKYDHIFIGGGGSEILKNLYSAGVRVENFFTSDLTVVARALNGLTAQGDEDTLLALDIAADFPFGLLSTTRRVIAIFTDEPIEDGVLKELPMAKMPELIKKLMDRRIQLFISAPFSPALELLGSLERAQIQVVDGGDGLQSVDFKKLLEQMGKSISISTMQMGAEEAWQKAIFGQDKWSTEQTVTEVNRQVVLSVGESAKLSTLSPLTKVGVKLQWTASVDLDLHAFYSKRSGADGHVWFAERRDGNIVLDNDAGIGDRGGRNEENITLSSLDELNEILFATKIYKKGGTYADYDGQIIISTDEGDEIIVPLTSTERADWCVIAKISNDVNGVVVTNINRVTDHEPQVDRF
jgi:uncharacterized protein involved in tellurium resistance